jgi:RNA polymerase sigma-70 factor, ECF subfamily
MINAHVLSRKMESTEEDLVIQAQAGDHAAFEALYRIHLGLVYAICVRILSDRSMAEEVTQKIFIRVWIKLRSFRGSSQFSSWLYRFSVNMILDELKSLSARDPHNILKEQALSLASCSEPLPNLRLDLNRAIDSLPRQARIVFILHDSMGFTHEEMAEALKIATGTCKAQLSRARMLLRKALKR